MTTKHFIAAAILLFALFGGTALASASKRVRDVFFFLIVGFQLYSDRMDVNFFSMEWYRGTTRGFEVSLLDILTLSLLIGVLLMPTQRPRFFWPASFGFMLLFLLFEGISVAMSQPKIFGAFEASKMVRAMIVFLAAAFYVRGERELRILVLALAAAVCLEALYSVRQRLLWNLDRSPGTFDHPNSLSLYICTVSPVLVAGFNSRFPNWLRHCLLAAIGAATITMFLTVSRAGIPVYAFIMLCVTLATVTWNITIKKIATSMAILVAMIVPLVLTWDKIRERYLETNIEEEIATNQYENRGQYFGLAGEILQDNPSGIGLNNWSWWVSKLYGPRAGFRYEDYDSTPPEMLALQAASGTEGNYAPPAHNLFVLTVGEMGWIGLFVFLLLWFRWLTMGLKFLWIKSADPLLRMGTGFMFSLGGIFLQSQTEWVYRQTTVMFTFYAILGSLASLLYLRKQARKQQKQASLHRETPPSAIHKVTVIPG